MFKTILSALGLMAFAATASAHAGLEPTEAAVGSTTKISVRVPHGCKGEATHTVRIELPEGVYAAKPMPKAGWTLETVTGAYAAPFDNHGTQMTEGVRQIIWSGGNLQDDWFDEFTFRATVGPDLKPGAKLYFPTLQTCANGTADWTDTTGNHDLPNPAPGLTLIAKADHGGHAAHGAMQDAGLTLGSLTLKTPFARATLPGAPVAGGFLTVTNSGTEDDRLIAAASTVAGHMEIHEMAMQGDVMKMRELADGLPIPAGQTVTLEPGGYHLMLMDLKAPLVEGETVTVTLTFEHAGSIDVPLSINAPNARDAGHHGHGAHKSP